MPTNPIKPTQPQTTAPATTTAASTTTQTATNTQTATPAKAVTGVTIPRVQNKPSPLKEQHRDTRGQPDYSPVQIIILNGAYKGKSVDLGLAVNEVMHSETADWEAQDGDGIRVGINFKRLSPRDISLTLAYCSLVEDVSYLVENVKHLKEITDGESRPPLLLFIQGALQATECVCTSVQDKYSEPHPGRKGLRRADVDIKLLLGGGKNSSYALGGPLTSTPLGDERARTTQAERQKQGQQDVAKLLLAPCLGEKGSADLSQLIEQNKLSDPTAIAKLDSATFVQAAIGGMFSSKLLQDPGLQQKLQQDLAAVMALGEDGVGNTILTRKYANAILTGDISQLPQNLQLQLAATRVDFNVIYKAVLNQALDEKSEVFDRSKNPTAGERLANFGSCGIDLRRVGAPKVTSTVADTKTLKQVNEFLASNPSNNDIKKRFGVVTESQIRAIKNGAPYQSKEEFLSHASQNNVGLTGQVLWSSFVGSTPAPQPETAQTPQTQPQPQQ
ncbi:MULTISPECIES: hypothetical protein [Trichocoleus]|uniref:Uncharacterized protein n=1 Tax=Trichocoleus desertorum GB2-A4 TaxID=2933944 RepID=A0ABV0JEZ1_9CYAN|nr:hypothetical protein [Trichocoleus sp. FACHB-46]MBD1864264.1 hypothetical protein [Trichocoleus sp. FACHB-46]